MKNRKICLISSIDGIFNLIDQQISQYSVKYLWVIGEVWRRIGVCLISGVNQAPYRWVWDQGPLAPGVPKWFSSQESSAARYNSWYPTRSGSLWEERYQQQHLRLHSPSSEPPQTLSTSQITLSQPLHLDSHLLLPCPAHLRPQSTPCGIQLCLVRVLTGSKVIS